MEVTLSAYICINRVGRITPYTPADYSECFRDFYESSCDVLKKRGHKIVQASVIKMNEKEELPHSLYALNSQHYFFPKFFDILKYDVTYSIDVIELKKLNDNRDFDESEMKSMWASILSSDLFTVCLLASISYPGRFHTGIGQVFLEDSALNPIENLPGLTIDTFSTNYSWPIITILPLKTVDEWERRLGLFECGVGDTPVKRALASYTHLQKSGTYENLFFAMQGLESFYCRGTGDLQRQLSEKAQLFLGQFENSKKSISKLYDMRSKFVHGDFPIMHFGAEVDVDSEFNAYDEEMVESSWLSVRLLTGTIHKCIRENITSIEYKWTISTNADKVSTGNGVQRI